MKNPKLFFQQLRANKMVNVTIKRDKHAIVGMVLLIVFFTSILSGIAMYITNMETYQSLFLLGIVCIFGWVLNRAGHWRISLMILISSLLIAIQYNIFQGYGIHDVSIIAWPALIFFVGLLFGSRVIPYFTGLIMLLTIVTWVIPNANDFVGDADTGDLMVMLLILVAFSFVCMSILRGNEISVLSIQRSNERFQAIYNSINDAIFIYDPTTKTILNVNRMVQEMFGFSTDEALQLDIPAISSGIPPYTPENASDWINKAVAGEIQNFEWQAKDKSGRLFWVDINMKLVEIDNLTRVLISVRDITGRKLAEEARRESELRFMQMADLLPQIIFECDLQGQVTYANQHTIDLFGYKQVEPGIMIYDYLDVSQHERIHQTIQFLLNGQEIIDHKFVLRGLDGNEFHVLFYSSLIYEENKPCGIRGIAMDVSEVMRFRVALHDSEERYRKLFENSAIGLYRTTPEGKFVIANPTMIKMMGFASFEEFSSQNIEKEVYETGYDRTRFIEIIERDGIVQGLESSWKRKDGSMIYIRESAGITRDEEGNSLFYDGLIEDITEHKLAEKARKFAEANYRSIFENATVGIFQSTPEGRFRDVNWAMARIYGYDSPEDMLTNITNISRQIYVDPNSRQDFQLLLAIEGHNTEFIGENYKKDGSIIWTSTSARSVKNVDGQILYFEGFITDITESKKAEADLLKLKRSIDQSIGGIARISMDGTIVFVNEAWVKMHGYSIEEIIGSNMKIFHTPGQMEHEVGPIIEEVLRNGASVGEIGHVRKDGSTFLTWMEVTVIKDDQQNPIEIIGSAIDISDRKRVESALKASEAKFAKAFRMNPSTIVLARAKDGLVLEVNDTFTRVFGYTRAEFVGSTTLEKGFWVDPNDRASLFSQVENGSSLTNIEVRFCTKDKRVVTCSSSFEVMEIDGEAYIMGVLEDITEKKQIAEKLLKSEARYRAVVENSHDGIILMDAERVPFYVSPSYTRINGFSSEEWIEGYGSDYIHPDDLDTTSNVFREIIQAPGNVKTLTHRIHHKMGHWLWVETTFNNLLHDPDIHAIVINSRDITERKLAEEALIESTQRLKEAQRIVHIGNWELNLTNNRLEWSDEIYRIFELDPENFEASYAAFLEAIHPDDRDSVNQAFTSSLETRMPYDIDHRLLMPDGRVKYVHERCETYYSDKGEPLRSVGTVQDVSDLMITEAALKESNELQNLFMRHSPVYTYIKEVTPTADRLLQASDNLPELIGTSEKNLVGKTTRELFPPEFAAKIIADDRAVVANGEVLKLDEDFNGRHYTTIKFPLIIGNKTLLAGYTIDITERKSAEKALNEATALTIAIVDSTMDMIWSVDPENFGLTTFNNGLRKYFDEKRGMEIRLGMRPEDLFESFDLINKWRDYYLRALAEGPYSVEYPTSAGSITLNLTFNLLQQEGKVFGISVFGRDITERLRGMVALQESENKYRTLFEQASDGIFYLSVDHKVLDVNESFARMHGYTIPEMRGMTLEDLDTPETALLMPERMRRVLAGETIQFEVGHYHKDGHQIPLAVSTGLITINNEQVIQAFHRDITERKLAEAAIHESEARFRAFIEQSPVAIGVFDLEGKGLYANQKFIEILGLIGVDEMVGRPAYEYFEPQFREQSKERTERRLKGLSVPDVYESVVQDSDGTQFPVSLAVAPVQLPGGPANIVFLTDISERKHAEELIYQSEKKYRELFQINKDGISIFLLNPDGQPGSFAELNDEAYSMLGYTKDEMLNLKLMMLEENISQEQLQFRKSELESKGRVNFETVLLHKNGHRVFAEFTSQLITFEGKPAVMNIQRDISERKRSEENRIAREIAEQASHAKSEFLSRISHELRTPLNAILGFGQLLKMDELKPNQTRGVDQINKSGRHLLNLVNEVLDIARIESGHMHISPEPIRLTDAVMEAVDLIRPLAEARHISLSLEIPSAVDLYVQADHQSFRQVLLNLFSNAVKYNREGGQIDVSTMITIDGQLRLLIQDTGEGILPEKMDRLFTPFERLGKDSVDQEGAGLGLALSKGLVEAMGGRIGAESIPGVGSTFWVELNLASEKMKETIIADLDEHLTDRMRSGHGLMLYIEDNLTNIILVEAIVERMPMVKLITAMQGRLALDLAREHQPDMILLDLHLPDIQGQEVLRQLKADLTTQNIPVIILSADAIPENITDMLTNGAHAYLTKPVDIKRLLKVLEEFLGSKHNVNKPAVED